PPELDRITRKAIAKKPKARYQSALEFRSDLVKVRDLLGREDSLVLSLISRKSAGLSVRSFRNLHLRLRRARVLFPAGLLVIFLSLLGVMGMPRFWPSAPHAPNPEAKRWYDMGTRALHDGAYCQASKALQNAINKDNQFVFAHARLAEAWTELDYMDKASKELLDVANLVPDRSVLAHLDTLYLEAITNIVDYNLTHAMTSYREIARLVPHQPQVYL